MKYYLIIFLAVITNVQLQAQSNSTKEEIEKLKSYIEVEDYASVMSLADKLIGNKVKEEVKEFAGDVYLYRGIARHAFGIDEDAIVDLKVAIVLNSKLKDAYFYISEIYYNLGAYSSALENVIYYLEAKPEAIQGLALKSKCLMQLGEAMAAKLTIQKAISIKSSEPELYYIRASINRSLGLKDLACKDANIAVKFGYSEAQKLVDNYCNKGE